MNSKPAPDKHELRRQLRAVVRKLSVEKIKVASTAAQALLRSQPLWQKAKAVLFYAALPGEIDLSPLSEEGLREGKVVALPRFVAETGVYDPSQVVDLRQDCAPGKFGIIEPVGHCRPFPLNQLDLVLVPGVGFDVTGRRLGRGQGFYDRLLAQFNGIKCGVAFDQQLVEQIPGEAHDVRMNFILTPTQWLETGR